MSIQEIEVKARELQELKRMREELETAITDTENAIKAAMGDAQTMTAGGYKITWKPVESVRFNGKAFQKDCPDLAAKYMIASTTRRFIVT